MVIILNDFKADPAEANMTAAAMHLAAAICSLNGHLAARARFRALHQIQHVLLFTDCISRLFHSVYHYIHSFLELFNVFFDNLAALASLEWVRLLIALEAELIVADCAFPNSFIQVQFRHLPALLLRAPTQVLNLVNCL